jgi:hypothetical protein
LEVKIRWWNHQSGVSQKINSVRVECTDAFPTTSFSLPGINCAHLSHGGGEGFQLCGYPESEVNFSQQYDARSWNKFSLLALHIAQVSDTAIPVTQLASL